MNKPHLTYPAINWRIFPRIATGKKTHGDRKSPKTPKWIIPCINGLPSGNFTVCY